MLNGLLQLLKFQSALTTKLIGSTVGLVPGLQDVLEETVELYVTTVKLHAEALS